MPGTQGIGLDKGLGRGVNAEVKTAQVDDRIVAVEAAAQGVQIAHVGVGERDIRLWLLDVEHSHLAAAGELGNHIVPQIPGTAGDGDLLELHG